MQEKHFWAKHTKMEQLVDVLQSYLDKCEARGQNPNQDLSAKQRHRTATKPRGKVLLKRDRPLCDVERPAQNQPMSIFQQPREVVKARKPGSNQFADVLIARSRIPQPDHPNNIGNMVIQSNAPRMRRDLQRVR
jgi:hypothetical protein